MTLKLYIYLIPPILSTFVSLCLAGASSLRGGRFSRENFLFLVVFLLFALPLPIFVLHHFIADPAVLLRIERAVHFFYVQMPVVYILLFHTLLKINRPWLVWASVLICGFFSIMTQTDYYFFGLYAYSWGYIAKGGTVFKMFGVYSFAIFVYSIYIFSKSLKTELNPLIRRRNQYFLSALVVCISLTMLNIPAISGYDFYPAGNFAFIPLCILGYAALKYRLLSFRDIINKLVFAAVTLALILIPNVLVFLGLQPYFPFMTALQVFTLLLFWFGANYIYLITVQSRINRIFDKSRESLQKAEIEFLESIFSLRKIERFEQKFSDFFSQHLLIPSFKLYLSTTDRGVFQCGGGDKARVNETLEHRLVRDKTLADRNLVSTHPGWKPCREDLLALMDAMSATYLMPIVREEQIIALVALPEKADGQPVSANEVRLINNIANAVAVSLANAKLFQQISDLNEDLKNRTAELSQEIKQREHSEEKYSILMESINEGFYELDTQGKITACNKAFARILGVMDADLKGLGFRNFLVPHQAQLVEAFFARLYATGKPLETLSQEVTRPDGVTCYVETTASLILDKDNRKIGFRGILRDVTERTLAEKEHARLEEQLMNARKMEALGTLAGGVAHDLNNILSGIVSYPEVLLDDISKEDPMYQSLVDIKTSGEKAAAVVEDLLTLARRGVPATEVVDLSQVVAEYLSSPEHAKLILLHPDTTVTTDLARELPYMLGSPLHLSKTVMNLVTNAFEAVPARGRVSVATADRIVETPVQGYGVVMPGHYIVLTVADNGIGIPVEDLNRIYEPFFTKKKMGRSGSGLGMAVVWGTVEDHRGTIVIDSRPGQGTSFEIYFPVVNEMVAVPTENGDQADCRGNGETVLVIDDVRGQRKIAVRMLERLGFSPAAVASGEQALEYLQDNAVDVILLDMIMDSGMDGLETYRRIIALHAGQKAVIASGYSETEKVRQVQALGAGPYIKKPYLMNDLGAAVKSVLEKKE